MSTIADKLAAALHSASNALCALDPDGDEHDAVIIDDALAAYRGFKAETPPESTGDHTSGPWVVEPGTLTVSGPNFKGAHRARIPVCYPQGTMNSEANMRRIVACVNALAPIPTQVLEGGGLEAVRQHLRSDGRNADNQVELADFDLVELASAAGFDIAEDVQPHRTEWGWGDEQGNGGSGFDSERDAILGALEHRYGPLWRFDVTNRQSRLGFVEFCQQAVANDGHTQGMKP